MEHDERVLKAIQNLTPTQVDKLNIFLDMVETGLINKDDAIILIKTLSPQLSYIFDRKKMRERPLP